MNNLVAENQKQMQHIAAELEKRNQMKHEPLIDLTQASERVAHLPNQPAGSGNIATKQQKVQYKRHQKDFEVHKTGDAIKTLLKADERLQKKQQIVAQVASGSQV